MNKTKALTVNESAHFVKEVLEIDLFEPTPEFLQFMLEAVCVSKQPYTIFDTPQNKQRVAENLSFSLHNPVSVAEGEHILSNLVEFADEALYEC